MYWFYQCVVVNFLLHKTAKSTCQMFSTNKKIVAIPVDVNKNIDNHMQRFCQVEAIWNRCWSYLKTVKNIHGMLRYRNLNKLTTHLWKRLIFDQTQSQTSLPMLTQNSKSGQIQSIWTRANPTYLVRTNYTLKLEHLSYRRIGNVITYKLRPKV